MDCAAVGQECLWPRDSVLQCRGRTFQVRTGICAPLNRENKMKDPYKDESISDETNRLIEINDLLLQAEEAGRKDGVAPYLHQDFNIIRANGTKQNREEF